MENNKSLISMISFVIMLVVLVIFSSVTYAFFTAKVTGNSTIEIVSNVSDANNPVVTAFSTGDLTMEVMSANMLESENNTIAATVNGNITVSFIGGGGTNSVTDTCTYDLVWSESSHAYTKSPEAVTANLIEYSIEIFDSNSTSLTGEVDMVGVSNNTALLSSESISSSGTVQTKEYSVVLKMYNLPVVQNIAGNSYSGGISIKNINC